MHTADVYEVRVRGDWHVFILDEKTGTFASYGTFGTYAYQWQAIGDRTLKQFVAGLDFDYFMNKAKEGSYTEFDAEKTIVQMKDRVLDMRRWEELTKEQAREAWRELTVLPSLLDWEDDESEFYKEAFNREAVVRAFNSPVDCSRGTRVNAQCRGFWDKMWPKFLEQIREIDLGSSDPYDIETYEGH